MTNRRIIAKTLTYRVLGTLVTFIASFFMTGSVVASSAISAVEFTVKPLMYYLHEKVWDKFFYPRPKTWDQLTKKQKYLVPV